MEFSWTLIHGLMRAGGLAGDERPTIRSRAACALCAFGRDLWTHGDAVDALMTEYRSIDGWWGARVARRGGAPLMDDASVRGNDRQWQAMHHKYASGGVACANSGADVDVDVWRRPLDPHLSTSTRRLAHDV